MIAHVVMFRFRPDSGDDERRALAAAFDDAIRTIPAIRSARVGERVRIGRAYETLMRSDYPYAAILEFDDREGLLAYLEHPAHAQLAARFFELFEDALIYDFELMEGTAALATLT